MKSNDPRKLNDSAETLGDVIVTVLKLLGDIMLACFMTGQQ